jgi:hypothetical protein
VKQFAVPNQPDVSTGEVMAVVQNAMLAAMPFTGLRDAILAHPTMAEGLGMCQPVKARAGAIRIHAFAVPRQQVSSTGRLAGGAVGKPAGDDSRLCRFNEAAANLPRKQSSREGR